MNEHPFTVAELIQSAPERPAPEGPGSVLKEGRDPAFTQAPFIGRIVPEVSECARGLIQSFEFQSLRQHPERARLVFVQVAHAIPGEAQGIVRTVAEYDDSVAVVLVQAVLSSKPHESVSVLNYAVHSVMRQAILDAEMFKLQVRSLAPCESWNTQGMEDRQQHEANKKMGVRFKVGEETGMPGRGGYARHDVTEALTNCATGDGR